MQTTFSYMPPRHTLGLSRVRGERGEVGKEEDKSNGDGGVGETEGETGAVRGRRREREMGRE